MRSIQHDSINQSIIIRFISDTTGLPVEDIQHDTAGLSLWYRRDGHNKVPLTPVSLAALNTAHVDGGILHIDDGYYRIDLPDAACANSAAGFIVGGTSTGAIGIAAYHSLVAFNPLDAQRMGLLSLPNALPAAAGGLPTVDSSNHVAGLQGTANQLDDLNDVSTAEVGTEIDNALTSYDAPTQAELTSAFAEIKGAGWAAANDSLTEIRQRGDVAWLTADTSSLSTFDASTDRVDVEAIAGAPITGPDDLKADVSNVSTFDASSDAVNVNQVTGVAVTSIDEFKADVSSLATAANQTILRDLLEADRYIDISTTPWNLVLIEKGSGSLTTGTELLRQELKDTTNANITDTTLVIGSSTST